MDGFQGAVLSVKLKHIRTWTEMRRNNAKKYNELLREIEGITVPFESDCCKHVYHIYSILTKNPDNLLNALREKEIFCAKHYPVPLHLQKAYGSLGLGKGVFPVAEKTAEQQLSLPMFPELTDAQIKYVCSEIKRYIEE